jgi:hypothetical protein
MTPIAKLHTRLQSARGNNVGVSTVSIVCTIKALVPVRTKDGLDPPYLHGR